MSPALAEDGRERLAALVFLSINGANRLPPPEELEAMVLEVAASNASKRDLTDWMIRQLDSE